MECHDLLEHPIGCHVEALYATRDPRRPAGRIYAGARLGSVGAHPIAEPLRSASPATTVTAKDIASMSPGPDASGTAATAEASADPSCHTDAADRLGHEHGHPQALLEQALRAADRGQHLGRRAAARDARRRHGAEHRDLAVSQAATVEPAPVAPVTARPRVDL